MYNILNKVKPSNQSMAFRKGKEYNCKANALFHIFVVYADDTYCDLLLSLFENYDETQITFFRDDSLKEKIFLDVREQDEYNEGHISNAILIPYTEIDDKAEEMLPDKDKLILVYCRSGRRSKIVAESLVNIGFTNVKEFGGIIDWPYEIEKE